MLKYETNSRLVQKGQTFVAIKGYTVDGHDFVDEAIANGAVAVIAEKSVDCNVPVQVVSSSKDELKQRIVEEYAKELKTLKFIGVTGTNGKTTTCYLVYQLLMKLGVNVAELGTLGFYHNEQFTKLKNTTPDILTLYKLLLDAKAKGVECIIMEVSSHALAEERITGLKFDVGAFTNLTQDHLDFHGTMENYLKEKLKLTNYLKPEALMLLNADDEAAEAFVPLAKTKSIGALADYQIEKFILKPDSTIIEFSYEGRVFKAKTNLTGKFNVYNYLMALAIVNSLGFKLDAIISKSELLVPPLGRCETIKVGNAYAVIDYAHTPDAVGKVTQTYNELKQGRVITIIGCGGDRDPQKRPLMGKIATEASDYVIFTNDNPRTEAPESIMNDITANNSATNYEVIYDRGSAIEKGLSLLKSGDILLILGKGHETEQIIGKEIIHFDDAEHVRNYIQKM